MKKSKTSKRTVKLAPATETFSYCVGRPWPKGLGNAKGTSISVYTHHAQVQHGTMADAEKFKEYVDELTGEENFIYRLVPVPRKKKGDK